MCLSGYLSDFRLVNLSAGDFEFPEDLLILSHWACSGELVWKSNCMPPIASLKGGDNTHCIG